MQGKLQQHLQFLILLCSSCCSGYCLGSYFGQATTWLPNPQLQRASTRNSRSRCRCQYESQERCLRQRISSHDVRGGLRQQLSIRYMQSTQFIARTRNWLVLCSTRNEDEVEEYADAVDTHITQNSTAKKKKAAPANDPMTNLSSAPLPIYKPQLPSAATSMMKMFLNNNSTFFEAMTHRGAADQMSPTALAYVGDAVFELFVRSQYVWPQRRMSDLQNLVVSIVRGVS